MKRMLFALNKQREKTISFGKQAKIKQKIFETKYKRQRTNGRDPAVGRARFQKKDTIESLRDGFDRLQGLTKVTKKDITSLSEGLKKLLKMFTKQAEEKS